MVVKGIQNLGQNEPWWAGWLGNGQNFGINLSQSYDKQMLKISWSYLDSYLSYGRITNNLLQQMAQCCPTLDHLDSTGPFVATNFQLFCHNSNINQDIFLKFSVFVYDIFILNRHQNFGNCSMNLPARVHFSQNFEHL